MSKPTQPWERLGSYTEQAHETNAARRARVTESSRRLCELQARIDRLQAAREAVVNAAMAWWHCDMQVTVTEATNLTLQLETACADLDDAEMDVAK